MKIAYRAERLYAGTPIMTCLEHIPEVKTTGFHNILVLVGKMMRWQHCMWMGKACLFDCKGNWNNLSWN